MPRAPAVDQKYKEKVKANFPAGHRANRPLSWCCGNWWFEDSDGICTGGLYYRSNSTSVFTPNYCLACAEAGLAGGEGGKDTGLRVTPRTRKPQPNRPSGWDPSLKTSAQRVAAGLPARGGNRAMSKEDVAEVMNSEYMKPVMRVEAGIERGRVLGSRKMYNFYLQLQRARDAPKGSRHRLVFLETELLVGLLYYEIEFFNFDIEKRQFRKRDEKRDAPGNRYLLYDAAIYSTREPMNPYEHSPFDEFDQTAFYNPKPLRSGVYGPEEMGKLFRKLREIYVKGKYAATWFGNEKTIATDARAGPCIIDVGYPARNLFGVTLDGATSRGTVPRPGDGP